MASEDKRDPLALAKIMVRDVVNVLAFVVLLTSCLAVFAALAHLFEEYFGLSIWWVIGLMLVLVTLIGPWIDSAAKRADKGE